MEAEGEDCRFWVITHFRGNGVSWPRPMAGGLPALPWASGLLLPAVAHVTVSPEVAVRGFGNLTIIILARPMYRDRALLGSLQRLSCLSTLALEKRQSRLREHRFIYTDRLGQWAPTHQSSVCFVPITELVSDDAETRILISQTHCPKPFQKQIPTDF